MYSRRFAVNKADLPVDYGGVTFRREEENRADGETRATPEEDSGVPARRGEGHDRRALPGEEDLPSVGIADAESLLRDISGQAKETRETTAERKESVLSVFQKGLSIEDILIAGIILLLIAEGREKKHQDGELILILGLLLLTGKK